MKCLNEFCAWNKELECTQDMKGITCFGFIDPENIEPENDPRSIDFDDKIDCFPDQEIIEDRETFVSAKEIAEIKRFL